MTSRPSGAPGAVAASGALKTTQIAWAKANGYEELHTLNEQRNAPIRRLDEEFGYRPSTGRIYLRGPLA